MDASEQQQLAKPPMIYGALAKCMAEIGAQGIAKNRENKGQNFMFRGIDQVYNALNPILSRHGVVFVPNYVERVVEVRQTKAKGNEPPGLIYNVTVRGMMRAYAEDGSYVEGATYGEAQDSGDKATNKAESAAYKYFAFQLFCIPTEETAQDADGDRTEHTEPQPKALNDEQLKAVRDQLAGLGIDETLFCNSLKIGGLAEVLDVDLPGLQKILDKKRAKLEAEKAKPDNDANEKADAPKAAGKGK